MKYQFECVGKECGNCCYSRGPSVLFLTTEDVTRLGKRVKGMISRRRGQSAIISKGGYCPLYKQGSGCTVYENRPDQCRSYPFWKSIVSPFGWARESKKCPGIGVESIVPISDVNKLVSLDHFNLVSEGV